MKYLSSKDVSSILGINISTLKRWTDTGKISCEKTAGGHRKFTMQHVREYFKAHADSSKAENFALNNKEQKFLYGLINDRDYKELAENLAQASLDTDEFLEMVPTKLKTAVEMVWSGEITDVKTIIGILWAERLLL